MLTRLDDMESRLQSLEAATRVPVSSISDRTSGAIGTIHELLSPPNLHTASAYKMLYCWPRIRLNLTIPGLVSTTYLQDADHEDPSLLNIASPKHTFKLWDAVQGIRTLYQKLDTHLPVYIAKIVNSVECLSEQRLISGIWGLSSRDQFSRDVAPIDANLLSISQLLILSLVTGFSETSLEEDSSSGSSSASAAFFTIALQRMWQLFASPDEERITLSLLASYSLVHIWARPFHAIGLLQSIDPALQHYSLRHPQDKSVSRNNKRSAADLTY